MADESLIEQFEEIFESGEYTAEFESLLDQAMQSDTPEAYHDVLLDGFYDAVREGHAELCIKLLDLPFVQDAIKKTDNYRLESAIENALDEGYSEIYNALFQFPAVTRKFSEGFLNSVDHDATDNVSDYLKTLPIDVLLSKNHEGMNALQMAIHDGQTEMAALLLNDERFKNTLLDRDLYGRTALDIAHHKASQESIALIADVLPLDTPGLRNLDQKIINIRQNYVIDKLSTYLTQEGREAANILDQDGVCNGLSFLHQIYTTAGKQDEFFAMLETIVAWDGQDNSELQDPVPEILRNNYKNKQDLFEQIINDLALLQFTTKASEELGFTAWTQSSRKEQYNLIRDPSAGRNLENITQFSGKVNREQLVEILTIFGKYPGANIDVGGSGHATSLCITQDGKFSYYDPNAMGRVPPFTSPAEVADHIIKYKYEKLDVLEKDQTFDIDLRTNKFYPENRQSKEIEGPVSSTPITANDFTQNGFSELHVAVLINNKEQIHQLILAHPECIDSKDAHHNTPLHLAITNEAIHPEALNALITNSKNTINDRNDKDLNPLELAIRTNNHHVVAELLKMPEIEINSKNKFGMSAIAKALESHKFEMFKNLLNVPNIDLNIQNIGGQNLLMWLVQAGNHAGVQLLLEQPGFKMDINQNDQYGNNALLLAVKGGNVDIVKTLIAAGATVDLKQKDSMDFTLEDWAKHKPNLMQVLRNANSLLQESPQKQKQERSADIPQTSPPAERRQTFGKRLTFGYDSSRSAAGQSTNRLSTTLQQEEKSSPRNKLK